MERKICVDRGGLIEVRLETSAFIDAAEEFSEWWYHFMLLPVMYMGNPVTHIPI